MTSSTARRGPSSLCSQSTRLAAYQARSTKLSKVPRPSVTERGRHRVSVAARGASSARVFPRDRRYRLRAVRAPRRDADSRPRRPRPPDPRAGGAGIGLRAKAFRSRAAQLAYPSSPRAPARVTWCHGAPGVALGRTLALPFADDAEIRREIEIAVDTTLTLGMGAEPTLCHGDLGNLMVVARAAAALGRPDWSALVAHHTSRIVTELQRERAASSSPRERPSPPARRARRRGSWPLVPGLPRRGPAGAGPRASRRRRGYPAGAAWPDALKARARTDRARSRCRMTCRWSPRRPPRPPWGGSRAAFPRSRADRCATRSRSPWSAPWPDRRARAACGPPRRRSTRRQGAWRCPRAPEDHLPPRVEIHPIKALWSPAPSAPR